MNAWGQHQSSETQAAFDREVALLDKHMFYRTCVVLAALLTIDAIGIYYFWRYEPWKAKA